MVNSKIIISTVISVLVVVVALLATQAWNPQWNPFGGAPSHFIEDELVKLSEAKTVKAQWLLSLALEGELGEGMPRSVNIALSFDQRSDSSDVENPKLETDFNLKLGMEGIELNLGGKTIAAKEDLYVKLTSIPALPFLPPDILEGFKNKWIKVNLDELGKQLGLQEEEEVKVDEKEFLEKLRQLLREKNIFEVKKDLGKEEINGIKAKRYLVEAKKDSVKDIMVEIMEYLSKYVPDEEKANYEQSVKSFSDNFDQFWTEIAPVKLDFWIGDGWVRKINFEKEFEGETTTGEASKAKLGISVSFSEFNKKFDIKIPEDAKPIEEFIQDIFQAGLLSPSLPEAEFPQNDDLKSLEELEKLKNLPDSEE